jgi:hypothetical protein
MIVFEDPKDPSEEITLTFDFSARGLQASSATVGVRLIEGIDSDPSTMLVGSPQYDGACVLQRVKGGVKGCKYKFMTYATVDSDRLLIEAMLTVGNSSCNYDVCE